MMKDRHIVFSSSQTHGGASNTPESKAISTSSNPILSSGVATSGLNTEPCCPSFCYKYVYISGAIRVTIQNVGLVFVNDE